MIIEVENRIILAVELIRRDQNMSLGLYLRIRVGDIAELENTQKVITHIGQQCFQLDLPKYQLVFQNTFSGICRPVIPICLNITNS